MRSAVLSCAGAGGAEAGSAAVVSAVTRHTLCNLAVKQLMLPLDVYKRQLKYLRPDGKSQVTVEYDENDKPVRLDAVVSVSYTHLDVYKRQGQRGCSQDSGS